MAKNNGLTNSRRYFFNNKFDVEKCFKDNCNSINNSLTNIKHIIENSESYTDDDIKFYADNLSNEFYTIIKTAINWENKKLK